MAKRHRKTMPPITDEMIRQFASRFPDADDFRRRLLEGLQISTTGPARHLLRRGEQLGIQEFFPDRCWNIIAMPSFHSWGLFAVFESRSAIRCAFVCKGEIPEKPDMDCAVVDCFFEISEWEDPVMDLLSRGPIAPIPDRSLPEGTILTSCDGIGYVLQVETPDVSAVLRFSNPNGSHYRALERAACDLAAHVARVIQHPQVSSFVKTWRSYVRN
jgi:hypothetical protein